MDGYGSMAEDVIAMLKRGRDALVNGEADRSSELYWAVIEHPDASNVHRAAGYVGLGNICNLLAPHLDGGYTIFGHIESGGSVVNKILSIPLKGEAPSQRIAINRAYVVDDIDAYFQTHSRDPIDNMGQVQTTQLSVQSQDGSQKSVPQTQINQLIAILLSAIILVSLLGVLLQKHIRVFRPVFFPDFI